MYGSALIISWPESTAPDITGYEVYFTPNRATPFGDVPVATTNAATLIAAVPNAQPGYYAVTTVDAGGRRTMYQHVGTRRVHRSSEQHRHPALGHDRRRQRP